ncbi:hypothetical protein K523DRAFT_286202 [Schizophyllum commune Tattone D]|nr:hypothetical protein K523DRAFT_286202 [Schizophyllum commune Tattone D]
MTIPVYVCGCVVLALRSSLAGDLLPTFIRLLFYVAIFLFILMLGIRYDPNLPLEADILACRGIAGMRTHALELLLWRSELLAWVKGNLELRRQSEDPFLLAYNRRCTRPSSQRMIAYTFDDETEIQRVHHLSLSPLSIKEYQASAVTPNFFTPYETVYHNEPWSLARLKKWFERLSKRWAHSPP